MNYYLVDFENVRSEGLKNLIGINEKDAIVIFIAIIINGILVSMVKKANIFVFLVAGIFLFTYSKIETIFHH